MERLTERTGEGQAIPRMDLKNNGHQRCMKKLAEYEDLGMEPWEIEKYIRAAGPGRRRDGKDDGMG